MKFGEVLSLASEKHLQYSDAEKFAEDMQLALDEFANRFAIQLATGYRANNYSYEFCDGAANWLFGFMTQKFFLSSVDNELPSPAFEIYLAFDEGEYHHQGDSDGVVAEEKYTRAQINQILAKADL